MSIHSAELPAAQQALEKERIFDAFRRWGYLDASLNPFGGPVGGGFPELRMEGEIADEARRIYCGTIGAEFMHIYQSTRGCTTTSSGKMVTMAATASA
jgi:2-oxoglutarate dehydrogenase E1 component